MLEAIHARALSLQRIGSSPVSPGIITPDYAGFVDEVLIEWTQSLVGIIVYVPFSVDGAQSIMGNLVKVHDSHFNIAVTRTEASV